MVLEFKIKGLNSPEMTDSMTNKFQVSFCSPFKFVRCFFVENKQTIENNKGADAQADLHLCCSHMY